MRSFSSAARSLLEFIWKGTKSDSKYESMIKEKISRNDKLAKIDRVEIHGSEHTSKKDTKLRVSGQLFDGTTRVTSLHAYHDGKITYSKASYNESQK